MQRNVLRLLALLASVAVLASCGSRGGSVDSQSGGASISSSPPSSPSSSSPSPSENSSDQNTSSSSTGEQNGPQLFSSIPEVLSALDALKTKALKSFTLTQDQTLITKSGSRPITSSFTIETKSKEVVVSSSSKSVSYKGLVGDTYYDVEFDAQGSPSSGSRKKVLETTGNSSLESDQILKTEADTDIDKYLGYANLDSFITGRYDLNTNLTYGGLASAFPGTVAEGSPESVELSPLSVTKNTYGITTVSYSSYKEQTGNNLRYGVNLRFNDQKELLSNSFVEYYKVTDDAAWDKEKHEPITSGDNVNYWHYKETLNEVDASAREETGNQPLIADKLSTSFVNKINTGGLVFYPLNGMGEPDTAKPNELTQGSEVTIGNDNFVKSKIEPQTAIDLTTVRIISSSDTKVITKDEFGWTALGVGETDLTIGNSFVANLGVVHVKVIAGSGETSQSITSVSDEMGNMLYSSDGTSAGFTTSLQPDAGANKHFWNVTVTDLTPTLTDFRFTLDDESLIDKSTKINVSANSIEIELTVVKAGTTTAHLTYKNNAPISFPFTVNDGASTAGTINRIVTADNKVVYSSAGTSGFETTVGSTPASNLLTVNVEGGFTDLNGIVMVSSAEDVASIAVVTDSLEGTINPTFKLQVTPKKAGTSNISLALSQEQVDAGTGIVSFDITVK